MLVDLRLSDYCTAKSHVIYLVVKFPGASCAGPPTGHDTEDVEIEPSTLTDGAESSVRPANPRIVLRGTVTIPVFALSFQRRKCLNEHLYTYRESLRTVHMCL